MTNKTCFILMFQLLGPFYVAFTTCILEGTFIKNNHLTKDQLIKALRTLKTYLDIATNT